MRRVAMVLVGSFVLLGCGTDDGGGDAQAQLAELLVQDADASIAIDMECVRGKSSELSDDQAQFLIDNIGAESTDGFDVELQAWVASLDECIGGVAQTGDRELFNAEVDGVRAMVADCFVLELSDGSRRYSTTLEVENGSDVAQTVTVTIDADLGRGGVSDSIEVPAGARDAWPVTSDAETADAIGDVECADYINDITVTLGPAEE